MRVCVCVCVRERERGSSLHNQRVHVHLDVGGSGGKVPEREGSILVQESRE